MNASCFGELFHLKFPTHRITLSSLYVVVSITASVLNFLIILTIWRTPSLHKPSNILLGNLAVTDLIVGILGNPVIVITNVAALNDQVQLFCYSWIIGRVIGYWLGSTSLYTLAVISVDRLLAILLRNRYRTVVTVKRIIITVVCWWLCTGLIIMPIVTVTEIRFDIYIPVVAVALCVMLTIITVCYALSLYRLKKVASTVTSNMNASGDPTFSTTVSNFRPIKYRKLLNTMMIIMFTIFVFYTPYLCTATAFVVTSIIHSQHSDYEDHLRLLYRLMTISELIVGINPTVNPVLYLWRMKVLRESVSNTTRGLFRRVQERSYSST